MECDMVHGKRPSETSARTSELTIVYGVIPCPAEAHAACYGQCESACGSVGEVPSSKWAPVLIWRRSGSEPGRPQLLSTWLCLLVSRTVGSSWVDTRPLETVELGTSGRAPRDSASYTPRAQPAGLCDEITYDEGELLARSSQTQVK